MAYKCELCGEFDAKKVWFDANGKEKYICNKCDTIVNERFHTDFFRYVYEKMHEYVSSHSTRMSDDTFGIYSCKLAVLKLLICSTKFSEEKDCARVDDWFYIKDKRYEYRCSEIFMDGQEIECKNIRINKTRGKKPIQDLTFRFSKFKIGEAMPIVDNDDIKIVSDPSIGYKASKFWIVIQDNIEGHDTDDLGKLLSLM